MKSMLNMLCALCLAGCVLSTPEAPTDAGAYGEPVERSRAEAVAAQWLSENMRDPDSVQARWLKIDRFFSYNGINDTFVGYGLDATVNARNGFGGMSGPEPYTFVFYDGKLTHVFGMKYQPAFRKRMRSRLWSSSPS